MQKWVSREKELAAYRFLTLAGLAKSPLKPSLYNARQPKFLIQKLVRQACWFLSFLVLLAIGLGILLGFGFELALESELAKRPVDPAHNQGLHKVDFLDCSWIISNVK